MKEKDKRVKGVCLIDLYDLGIFYDKKAICSSLMIV